MNLAEIKLGCCGCGSLDTKFIISDKKQKLYWMAANKGTHDFSILMSSLQEIYVGSLTPSFPMTHHDKFDYFCTDCFLKFNKEESDESK
jgi:hypothetical protein